MIMKRGAAPRTLARRLLPLQIGMALQGLILWVPIEKLFMTQIGFDAASVGAMAAAYAAVVPLLEVPSGILADRWSRSRLMVVACVALMVSSLLGGLSQSVIAYVIAATILGVYFAFSSGTVDSIVYVRKRWWTASSTAPATAPASPSCRCHWCRRTVGTSRCTGGSSLATLAVSFS
jgi:MFS family permease